MKVFGLYTAVMREKDREDNNLSRLIVLQEEVAANSVPAAAVIQRRRALFGFTGRKACAGG